ncbi:hypothetical protein EW026_g3198 [Hermanssonia centrifuga]|uniref:type I protein arginine methyltransferase n=1 Tax=Hermanssonia centrifuga TaxID=98765 RepID=A0A4S4KKZ0_9APHY|nr:hypothetical protein EW026_g3198 [Hermanssonia centrifuga]
MAFRLSAGHLEEVQSEGECSDRLSSSSSEEDEQDLAWDDWVSDSMTKLATKSLFDDTILPSVAEEVEYDKKTHAFDLEQTCVRLGLDMYKRIRLINWIRKEKPTSTQASNLQGNEEFFDSDQYLIPASEDDPLLQTQPDDSEWSDEEAVITAKQPSNLSEASRRIQALEKKLQKAQQDLVDYRDFVASTSTHIGAPLRDDDSHYFQSYGENDIHAVMIQDKVRTATYAAFIMKHPELFRGATVLDVGCGTGILSLFAARAGAKRVISVDASDIAEKAEKIIKANGFEDVITVIRGKVEDITLPDGITQVDVIISEWMGYALLYESMLDSVLHARDRFLRPEGVMAPSQTKMMFGLCEAGDILKERITFWGDIYGFDLSEMATDVYEDAIVDVVGPESMASEACVVKDLHLGDITTRQLDFSSPFTLVATTSRRTKIHAFVLYFDTYFNVSGGPVPEDTDVYVVREGDPILAEVWQVGSKPHMARRMSTGDNLKPKSQVTSFSTGPLSVPTHWKQTLFLLREPIVADEGTIVQGVFKCRKSDDNSRELDVEIHYSVKEDAEAKESGNVIVQTFKVR